MYRWLIRPLLFSMDADTAHDLGTWFLRRRLPWKLLGGRFRVEDEGLRTELAGISLPNPVGLAAGLDKDCEMAYALSRLGFGYITVGTITYRPRRGNPRPRLLRVEPKSLVNSMGLPSVGVHAALKNLSRAKGFGVSLVVSVAGLGIDEFVSCVEMVQPYADAVELNISSPNERGLWVFQAPEALDELLEVVNKVKRRPIFVKLPCFPQEDQEKLMAIVRVCAERGVDAITAINTKRVEAPGLATGTGGLSGKAIFKDMLRIVKDVYSFTGGAIPINACGGIFSGEDAIRAFQAGATTVQVLTGLVYEGVGVAKEINKAILGTLRRLGVESVKDLRSAII